MRKIKLENNTFYHVYNRGANQNDIFFSEKDYFKFLFQMRELNNESTYSKRQYIKNKIQNNDDQSGPASSTRGWAALISFAHPQYIHYLNTLPKLVEIISYCLNHNHFHFILKQITNNGIKKFMHKLGTGYVGYINSKYKWRSGVLFERNFEAYPIHSINKLLYLSAYVNCNAEVHRQYEAREYMWSSYRDFLGLRQGTLCNKKEILSRFRNIDDYENFCAKVVLEASAKKFFEK